jgi:hypothetical protein
MCFFLQRPRCSAPLRASRSAAPSLLCVAQTQPHFATHLFAALPDIVLFAILLYYYHSALRLTVITFSN